MLAFNKRDIADIKANKVIHLVRVNCLHTALSRIFNFNRPVHSYEPIKPVEPVMADMERVNAVAEEIKKQTEWWVDYLRRTKRKEDLLVLTYEDITNDLDTKIIPDDQMTKICNFLGVEHREMVTTLYKTCPSWQRVITNYSGLKTCQITSTQ
jgi:hypothetical protein